MSGSRLAELAARYGVEAGYEDVWKEWHATPHEAQRAVLASMGVDARDERSIEAAIAAHERARCARVLAPVTVLRLRRHAPGVRIRIPEALADHALAWRIASEDGTVREERFDPLRLAHAEDDDGALALPLPGDLAEGYHRLAILDGGALLAEGMLVVAPERCYSPGALADGARVWGPALQLYALRSERNAGIGDFTDLKHAVEAWAAQGAALVGVNPLHAIPLRETATHSPYSPTSRLFLNVLYIDVEAVEDFAGIAARDAAFAARWRDESARLRESPEVDYARVAAAKRAVFEALFAHFRDQHMATVSRRARAFAQFREARGAALRRHALHEALADFHSRPWHEWPDEHRDPERPGARRFAAEHPGRVLLHEYLQWQADLQLAAAQSRARELGMALGLYADLAVSVAADGSEAWANQGAYALGASVGAPPDEFNPAGQDWGLPPLAPHRLREHAYAPFIATLRANMARAGALRIDHVMGLSRLYWVPRGTGPADGAYVRYPLDDLLGIVALESHRHRCLVIGEDLGTVSGDLQRSLADAAILSYRLLLFERQESGFKPPSAYPRQALVAWSTHDLPTLAGWWEGRDIDTREQLSLLDAEAARKARGERSEMRGELLASLRGEKLLKEKESPQDGAEESLALAVHAFLAGTPCAVMAVQLEDVFGVAEQANLPGTVTGHPNWRRKLSVPLERWGADARVKRLAQRLASIRGRARSRRDAPAGLENAKIPRATYRLQLHGDFTFRDATALVPYLADLGVSHVYTSPFLRARPGSRHGYDIVDHTALNPEIGSREDLDRFVAALRAHGMGLMMDIVPNHMGVLSADNPWWQDVLENGPASAVADFFDIDWHPPSGHLANRVLLPILGDHYGVELAAGHIALAFEAPTGSFAAHYHEHRLPIDPSEYPRILAAAARALEGDEAGAIHAQALRSIADAFARLPTRAVRDQRQIDERTLGKEVAKGRLAALARSSGAVAAAIAACVDAINRRPDDPSGFDALHELLEAQAYRLAYWRVAQDEINYRRFFDINGLAALRQENEATFEATHRLVVALAKEGAAEALRIDHPDGLYDPKEYFRRLQEACGKPMYVAVEKIVAPFENVPEDWAVHGTTGYRFANVVNGLFVDPAAEARMTRIYRDFAGIDADFEEIARRARRLVLRSALASELTVLTSLASRIARADRNTRDFTFTTLREGLAEILASFPVYRTYIDDEVHADDRRYIDGAVSRARTGSIAADASVFDFLRDALACELPVRSPAIAALVRHFARKFQQLSAPVMAKGVEDTSFYVYARLISLNDVGGDPSEFGFPPARFHRASSHRARRWPHTMLATSTHDNKRSEDVRARIDALSEMTAGWRLQLRKWARMNEPHKRRVEGSLAPSSNDEYILYQTLLGSFPMGEPRGKALGAYAERIVEYMRKATREAKLHTSWARMNEAYEAATESFVRALLEDAPDNEFLADLRASAASVTWIGLVNSLAILTVKLTSPGIPDCYQGNELWDFSLVDPDNRRAVDYALRRKLLDEVRATGTPAPDFFAKLEDEGRAKLLVTWRLLQLRKEREALFAKGAYLPVRVAGERARHVVAYARRHAGEIAITVVPRLVASLGIERGTLPCGSSVWRDARLELPFLEPDATLRDAITGREHRIGRDRALAVAEALSEAPVAVMVP